MTGVFVSYTRSDYLLAKRVRNGLSSLGIDVLWDESMDAVDWQEYLESRIDAIPAVLVLWTPNSMKSNSVRDEARLALDTDKLVNLVCGVEKPRFPFDRINGLPIDNWVAGAHSSGWSRVISTLDRRFGAEGALGRALAAQIEDVARRREGARNHAREQLRHESLVGKARPVIAAAEAHLLAAETQLQNLQAMAATKSVMAAAWADRDEAKEALHRARTELSDAEEQLEAVRDQEREASRQLALYLASIGGDAAEPDDGGRSAEEAGPQPLVAKRASPPGNDADPKPYPQPVMEPLDNRSIEQVAETERHEPEAEVAAPTDESLESVPVSKPLPASEPDPNSAPGSGSNPLPVPNVERRGGGQLPKVNRAGARTAMIIAVPLLIAVAVAVARLGPNETSNQGAVARSAAAKAAAPESPSTGEAATPQPVASVDPKDWIIGSWVVDKAKNGCAFALDIALSRDGRSLVFASGDNRQSVSFKNVAAPNPVIETGDYRYELLGPAEVRGVGRNGKPDVRLEKC